MLPSKFQLEQQQSPELRRSSRGFIGAGHRPLMAGAIGSGRQGPLAFIECRWRPQLQICQRGRPCHHLLTCSGSMSCQLGAMATRPGSPHSLHNMADQSATMTCPAVASPTERPPDDRNHRQGKRTWQGTWPRLSHFAGPPNGWRCCPGLTGLRVRTVPRSVKIAMGVGANGRGPRTLPWSIKRSRIA
jgi:hypothetical protein